MNKHNGYECFGRVHTVEEWARMLNMTVELFRHYTEDRDLTVEDLYQIKGIDYKEPKRGRYKEKAREQFERIFMQSGHPNIDKLELQNKPGSPTYDIVFAGDHVGKYYYKEDRLVLGNGEGIVLNKIDLEVVKILWDGKAWLWHPKTREAWIQYIIRG